MAKVYFIATLMILQGFFLYGETSTSLMSSPSVTGSNILVTTAEATTTLGGTDTTAAGGGGGATATTAMGGGGGGTVTTAAGGGGGGTTVTTAMGGGGGGGTVTTAAGGGGGATVTTAMGGGGGGGTVTTAAGGGGGGATTTTASGGAGGGATFTTAAGGGVGGANSTVVLGGNVTTAMSVGGGGGTVTTTVGSGGISSSTTTTTIAVSSAGPDNKKPGSIVILILRVTIDCSGDRLMALNVSLQTDIKTVYTGEGFPIKSVITQSISCQSPLNITLQLSFYTGIPSGKTIKGVFQAALKDGKITNLTESNTIYTITFTGVTLEDKPKDGQCQTICCDGAGGELTVERTCTPTDKCEGIEPNEKKEDGHCSGDSKGTCPDTCDDEGIHNTPSYALVTLLAIATFTKTMFF